MEKLSFKYNTLDDDTIAHPSKCINKVERLELSYCKISSNEVEPLFDAIMKLNKPVCIMLYKGYSKYSSISHKKAL